MASRAPSLKGDKVAIDVEAGSRSQAPASNVLERFEVQKLLGEGGMGSVFVAHDRGLGRVIALKRLKDGLEKDRSALRRFVLEAQIGAQLEHPNIVPLYSFERSDAGSPAIAMQLLEGRTMSEYIEAAGTAPPSARAVKGEYSLKERIGTLLGVGEAIHFAHERGVIHRDLKPDNVMLGHYREVYVMDWGIARVLGTPIDMARERQVADGGQATSATATRQGEVMGTPQYMSPEQALGQIDKLGPAADQYSLGVILQELATLKPARSQTSTMAALTEALQSQLAPRIDVDGAALHPALSAIIARATQKNPSDRYPSVRAMTEDLRSFTRDEPVSVYAEGLARRLVRAAARRPVVAFSALSLCGFLASAGVVGTLIHDARQTARQGRELENVRRLLVAVSSRAHDIDVELSELAADVKAIGAATVERLERDATGLDRSPRTLPALLPFGPSGGTPVSFESIVITWPGQQAGAELPVTAAKLVGLEPWLRESVVDSLPAAERRGDAAAVNAALRAGHAALLRSFVGLEDGSFVQYPAREVSADPRSRPWYVMASRDPSLHWTLPVVDVSKKTLRISAVLGLRVKGTFAGVAGSDMRVASLAERLRLELPGFRRAFLVYDGKVAVSDTLEATILSQVKSRDEELDLPSVDDPTLARRIAGNERGGYVESGKRLFIFSKLISPPWTYVAEVEREKYVER